MSKKTKSNELSLANKELALQSEEKEKRESERIIANKDLAFQDSEKEKRAAELIIANKELAFQNEEKEKRANEREKRAEELIIANKELAFQNEEKEKRAAELIIANEELIFQNAEKEKRAAELIIANKELAFQNGEKEKRAAELIIANKELAFQNEEKEKRAAELILANLELKKAEEQFRLVVESTPNAMVLVNQEGLITLVNTQTEKLLGYTRNELVGNKLEILLPERFRQQHPGHRNVFFKKPQTRAMGEETELFALSKSGNEIQVEIGLNPIETAKGTMVLASIVDITESKMQEATLKQHNKKLAFQNEEKEKRAEELIVANKELAFQNEEKEKRAAELIIANEELVFQNDEKEKRAAELIIANKELAFQNDEKEKRAAELIIANKELTFQNEEKEKRAAELIIANEELVFQNEEKEKRAAELIIANKELAFQNDEKEKRAAELIIANKELAFQNKEKEKRAEEKEKRAEELIVANNELAFQNQEKEKRAAELIVANEELAFQNNEKEKRAAELIIANKELAFQSEEKEKRAVEKEKRAEELIVANKELAFQNEEKEKRAAELIIANEELAFQNNEKEKRAAELIIANKELAFQSEEKEKRAEEKGKRAEELIIANKELAFQNAEKEKRAAELIIANEELAFQNNEKEKRAAELLIANSELAFQNNEKEKRAAELIIANKELAFQNEEKEKRAAELSIANTLAGKQVLELAQQGEELQMQQEELKQMNEELEEQAQNLKQQQEELQLSNDELGEQTRSLEDKNKEVEAAKFDIEQKTKQLEVSSRYKSEFLANMSHELRTPLNSLLILSKDLSENRNNHLDAEEVESSEIIYKSGHDLLVLINEVLDLSKIEAGKMQINIEKVSLKNMIGYLTRDFKHLAEQKGLKLSFSLGKDLPESIRTDSQRLNQILKNLISNSIKFTEKGNVSITVKPHTKGTLIISVADTGIGIQDDKLMSIFEAFQQADGGTSRKFGGTGLGLSISRELAKLLGAEITLISKLNEGSTFSLIVPLEIQGEYEPFKTSKLNSPAVHAPPSESYSKYLNYPTIKDDRDNISQDDRVVLIIEDDLEFAQILLKQANLKGFKCLSAATGEDGLLLTAKYAPQAIILDMQLPGINGNKVLLELKANPSVRSIPVHIISANERSLESLKEGAVECLMKPIDKNDLDKAFNRIENFISRKIKNLLIIEDNENARKAIRVLIGNGDVKCLEAGTGKDALEIYQQNQIDCIILDIGLPDMTGFELIHNLKNLEDHSLPPIVVYTGKELSKQENNELQNYAESIIIKGIKSEERLLDETALFLHRTITNLPKSKQLIINSLHDTEILFQVKKILLVDDDERNVFALSKILKARGMEVIKAENGKNALMMLDTYPDIDLVLMDIMMPEMDGYEAMRRIRAQRKYKDLPIIALTAKAMKEDKQKCIDAGASDYITKPVDVDRLLSLMRVWLSK